MLKDDTIEFLGKAAPFNLLERADLEAIASEIAMEYYPRGVKILAQDGPPSEFLRIIKKGGVKVFMSDNEDKEIVIDFRSEGEHFGMLSVMSGDRSRANVVAVEDTICLLVPKEKILELSLRNPALNQYFLKSFFINFIDKTHDETRRKYSGLGEGDRLLFTTPVGHIVTKQPVTAPQDISIQRAASIMAEHKISSIILLGDADVPSGIITDRDLREKVVAKGRDISDPAASIMSSPLIRVDAEEFCFEALLKMMRYKIHHILVVEGGRFKGIVTNHDFMVLQGSSPTVLVKEMQEMQSLDSLAKTTPKLYKTVATLLREGAKAHNVTGLITELAEKMVVRMVDIIERKIGPSPLPYTLFIWGAGGRRELSLSMGLRLGVIYQDTNNVKALKETEQYFAELITRFNDSATICNLTGPAKCLEMSNVLALPDWKERFSKLRMEREQVGNLSCFIDMRPVRGDEAPCFELRDHINTITSTSPQFMNMLASDTVKVRPPLGFFKRFVVEKSGEHINELDIYLKGVKPLVNVIRILALEKGIAESSTIRRLQELRSRHSYELAEDVEHAFSYLLSLLIHSQLEQIEAALEPDNFLNPETLGAMEKRTLKETFQLIATLYESLEKRYRIERPV